VKLLVHRAGLPVHAVAGTMRAKGIFIYVVPLDPVQKTGLAGHVPVTGIRQGCRRKSYSGYLSVPLNYKNILHIEKIVL
jgi:hypothetical protein